MTVPSRHIQASVELEYTLKQRYSLDIPESLTIPGISLVEASYKTPKLSIPARNPQNWN